MTAQVASIARGRATSNTVSSAERIRNAAKAAFRQQPYKDRAALENYGREFRNFQCCPSSSWNSGYLGGGSLRFWEEFFPRGMIVGIDRDLPTPWNDSPRVRCFRGEQQDTAFLDGVAEAIAPEGFDIIIDDCSHIGTLTKTSFWHLYQNHLKPGGIYVIEDWMSGYMTSCADGHALRYDPKELPPENDNFHGHQSGLVGFVKELIDELARHAFFTPEPDPERKSRIAELKYFANHVFIYKPPRQHGPPPAPGGGNSQDYYVTSLPGPQNALDIFHGEWSSQMPAEVGFLTAAQAHCLRMRESAGSSNTWAASRGGACSN